MAKDKLISLGDLALSLGVKKSLLNYYREQGMLVPEFSAGRMCLFEKGKALKTIKKVFALKQEGKTLKEIKELL